MFLIILTPFLLEIILLEIYLMLGRKIKFHLMKFLLKGAALGLAIVNLCLHSSCHSETRTVRLYSMITKVLLVARATLEVVGHGQGVKHTLQFHHYDLTSESPWISIEILRKNLSQLYDMPCFRYQHFQS